MPVMLSARIAGTGTALPSLKVSTEELVRRVSGSFATDTVISKTGIASRYFCSPDDSPSELGARALTQALSAAQLSATDLEQIILVASGCGQLLIPASANLVARELGLSGTCACFDLNNACMGFLTAFDVAARLVVTGSGPVGIAVVETGSPLITPDDPRPYLVFGDAATAAVVIRATSDEGILSSWLRNDGVAFGNVKLDNAALTGRRETVQFTASNNEMGTQAVEIVRRGTAQVLARAGLRLEEVEWVLPHQPNGTLLEAIVRSLGVVEEKLVRVVDEFGSVGAASIPLSLDRLFRTRDVRPGDRILMVGVGAGISMGAILYRTAR
jgi:3-oxoacyl-(acyl-carrier-protein) synthase III